MFNPRSLPAHRRTAVVASVAFVGFAGVLLAIEALAVRGQLDFAQHVLGLEGVYVAAVPVALEGGTLVSAALALWATLTGDPSSMHRAWTWIFLSGAAGANWLGAVAAGRSWVAAAYLAAFCVAALRMWHAILHRVRRSELRRIGAVEPPLPRFRALRWLLAPRETFRAWRLAITEGVTQPDAALALARKEDVAVPAPARGELSATELAGVTKKAALEHAASVLGTTDVKLVRRWLSDRGLKTDYSNARKVLHELADDRRRQNLHAVPVAAEV